MHLNAYTDGSYKEKNGMKVYGSGIYIESPEGKIPNETNNPLIAEINSQGAYRARRAGNVPKYVTARNVAGEVLAAIMAIGHAVEMGATSITLYHDYEGVGHWATRRWRARSPIAKDYVTALPQIAGNIKIDYVWTRGHSGVYGNEQADIEAGRACDEVLQGIVKL